MNWMIPRTRLASLGLLVVMSLVVGGCSSTDTDTNTSAAVESAGPEGDGGDAPAGDVDCEQLGVYAAAIRDANGWVPQVNDAESLELIGGDLDEVDAAIEGLRPIQDIDGIFGPVREGLDNLAADIQAIRDGRYDEKVGGYNSAGIAAVLGEEVCK